MAGLPGSRLVPLVGCRADFWFPGRDSTTTAGAARLPNGTPPAMGQIAFDTPAQWGRRVYRSPNGRKETYELDFGRGNTVVTHVLWADPAADAQ
ncbi:MAG: hypothetical protein ACRD3C_14340 [Vicinamibacterales bacterium]